ARNAASRANRDELTQKRRAVRLPTAQGLSYILARRHGRAVPTWCTESVGNRAMTNTLALDLDHVLAHTRGLWDEFRGRRLFITGGTGFFGRWLLESLVWANEQLGIDASGVVLTRNPEAFARKAPHLAPHP